MVEPEERSIRVKDEERWSHEIEEMPRPEARKASHMYV